MMNIMDIGISSKHIVELALVGIGFLGYSSHLNCMCFEILWIMVDPDISPLH